MVLFFGLRSALPSTQAHYQRGYTPRLDLHDVTTLQEFLSHSALFLFNHIVPNPPRSSPMFADSPAILRSSLASVYQTGIFLQDRLEDAGICNVFFSIFLFRCLQKKAIGVHWFGQCVCWSSRAHKSLPYCRHLCLSLVLYNSPSTSFCYKLLVVVFGRPKATGESDYYFVLSKKDVLKEFQLGTGLRPIPPSAQRLLYGSEKKT